VNAKNESADDRGLHRLAQGASTADRDALYDALSHRHRRLAIATLEERGEALALADLAAEIADRDAEGEPAAERVQRIEIELYHVHAPKLATAGVVTFDRDENVVRLAA